MSSERTRHPDRKLSEEIGMLFARAHRISRQVMARTVDGKIESLVEFTLLRELVFGGGGTQAEIALRTSQHPAAVSRMIDELEQRKLIRRRRDPKDRRKFRVESTAAGRAQVEAKREVIFDGLEGMLCGLDHADRIALRNVLSKMVLALEEGRPAATSFDR